MLTHKGTQTIYTERLILRKFSVDDANDMFVWASNTEVVKYLSYKPHTSPEATAELLEGWVDAYNSNEVYNWAIVLNGIVVGSISVVDSDNKCFSCHLGWQIDEPYWNKGYMTEAAKAVLDFLFKEVGYNRISSGHDTRNIGSGKVMQKIGMSLEGTFRQYCYQKDGSIGDKHCWAILKSDWEQKDIKQMNKDIVIKTDKYRFGLRTVGVMVRLGKILVQREKDGNEYSLPGGAVKILENTEEALIREYKEETGADIKINRLLWTEEDFWHYNGREQHGLAFYYLVDLCDGNDIPETEEFVSQKDDPNIILGWMPIDNLKDITFYPTFLKDEIHNLTGELKHFISKE